MTATKLKAQDLTIRYGAKEAIKGINLAVAERRVTALIGPSGCGKSTFLRSMNRMNELIPGVGRDGDVLLNGESIYAPSVDVVDLRRRVGMVFQKSNPFPKSIFDNVAYGLQVQGLKDKRELAASVEQALTQAALWDEVKDRLDDGAFGLSGGQQQRLCIARALAVRPEVLLMDEPASALDPIATARIEELIVDLKARYTIVIVTHNMQQAVRVSDDTAFFYMGELVEFGATKQVFGQPKEARTADYVGGKFG